MTSCMSGRKNGCKLDDVLYEWQEAKIYITNLPQQRQRTAWRDIMTSKELSAIFGNLLHLVELLLVLPMSTAACERGFSCMKRIKTDWHASLTVEMLTKVMFISLNGPIPTEYDAAGAVKWWWKSGERTRHPHYME